MNKKKRILSSALLALALGAILALSSCAANTNAEEEAAAANRAYMSQVSRIMDDLTTELEGFGDAVAESNYVTMRTKAEGAAKVIEELDKLEVPDNLKDIHSEYLAGSKDLQEALDGYISLSTTVESATEEQPLDADAYEKDLKEIQEKYDSGIEHLKEADKKATEMP